MKRKFLIPLLIIPIVVVAFSFGGDPHKSAEMKKLKQAVKAGEITKAEAKEKMMSMKVEWAEQEMDTKWEKMTTHIENAVESGDMTREEADAKRAKLKAHFAGHKAKLASKGKAAKIKADVRAGELSKEEAKVKLKALKEECKQACQSKKDVGDPSDSAL